MQHADQTRPISGRRLGDFVVHELLGAGGQGEVYRAQQPALEREAVIKTLAGRTRHGGADRFLREAKLASRLDHPYAAHVYAFGAEPDGLLWIAMELVRGVTLADWLATKGPMPLERYVPLFERVCEVVHTAHDQGIIHRDLKPNNIMVVSRAGRLLPKLLDFGIAKAMGGHLAGDPEAAPLYGAAKERDPLTRSMDEVAATLPGGSSDVPVRRLAAPLGDLTGRGAVLGSPRYMAPELWFEAAEADVGADIYALGTLTYECLTGTPPFDAPTLDLLSRAHATAQVPSLGGEFPPALDEVLARAMAKDPEERYRNVLDLSGDFARASGIGTAPAAAAAAPEVIDGALREIWVARAPTPLADVFPRLVAGGGPRQTREALRSLVRALARYLGVLSLACRSRVASDASDSPRVAELVRALCERPFSAGDWIALVRALARPFRDRPDLSPVPELVTLTLVRTPNQEGPLADLAALDGALAESTGPEGDAGDGLARCRVHLERLLGACEFLLDYRLVVARRGGAECWMGVRRFHRPIAIARRRPLGEDEVALLDADGYPILRLSPAAQVAPPTPDRHEEMFLLAGGGVHGARLVAEPDGFERQDEGVWRWFAENRLGDASPRPAAAPKERHPYRALQSLTREDADLFFGREGEIDSLVNRLRFQPLVAVVGASGVGKSSFVQAGLVPALGPGWGVVSVRPGAHPALALEAAFGVSPEDLDVGLARLSRGAGALLVVDQLEELFTLAGDEKERERFARAVVGAARSPQAPARVVVTLRDDFLVAAEQVPAFRGLMTRGMQLLTTPHEEDLLRILEEPARRLGYAFEDPELPREMVREVARQPGALALLSFAAATLWERRDRDRRLMTRDAYSAIAGVAGALAQHADGLVTAMPGDEQTVREMFQNLFTAEGTRATCLRGELVEIVGRGVDGARVLDRLIEARLLVATEGHDGQAYVEVAHEALLSAWPRLAAWRREDAEGARRREQLQVSARQWRDRGRGRALLWRGDVLTELLLWRKGYAGRLSEIESEFLDESRGEAARVRRFRRAIAGILLLLVALGTVGLLWANRQTEAQRRAAEERLLELRFEQARQAHLSGSSLEALAFLREALASTEPDVAMRYLAASAMRSLDSEVHALRVGAGGVPAARFAGAARIVTGGWDDSPAIWHPATGAVKKLGELASALVLDVSDDGSLAAAGSFSGAAVWRVAGGELVGRFPETGTWIGCVDLSPDGSWLLTGGGDGVARLRRLAHAGPPLEIRLSDGMINACQLSPDGSAILTSSLAARIWDARTGRLEHTLGAPGPSTFARFSPDGSTVVTYRLADPTMELWDARSGARIATLGGHSIGVFEARFSRDGRILASAGRDRTSRLWDARTGALRGSLQHPAGVRALAFDPSGARLATSSGDRRIRIWQIEHSRLLAALEGHLDVVDTLEFSPDGALVLTASRDGTARLWRAAIPGLVRRLDGAEPLFAATFSGDGTRVMTYSQTGRAAVFEVATGARLVEIGGGQELVDPTRDITPMATRAVPALDRQGRRAAVPRASHLALLDVETGREIGSLDHLARVVFVRYGPDGRWLASGDVNGEVRIWDLESKAARRVGGQPGSAVGAMDISRDGRRLAWGNDLGELYVWDVEAGARVYSTRSHSGNVTAVAFSPDGRRVATGGFTRPIKIWSAARPELVATLEETEGTTGMAFAPDGIRLVAMHAAGTATVWDVGRGSVLDRIGVGGEEGFWVEVGPGGTQVLLTAGAAEIWDFRPYSGRASELIQRLDRLLPYALEGQRVIRTR